MINQETIAELIKENKSLKERCSELETQVNWLMEQLKINNKKTYGSKSEQTEYVYEQLSLLHNEAEFYSDIEKKEDVEVTSYTRKKKVRTLEKLPENIRTVVVEHTLPVVEQVCNKCGSQLEVIGKEVKQHLKAW